MKKLLIFLLPLIASASPQGVPVMHLFIAGPNSGSTVAVPNNLNRGYLLMQNNGPSDCITSVVPIVGGKGLVIGSGQNFEPNASFVKSPFYVSCSTNGSSIITLETNW